MIKVERLHFSLCSTLVFSGQLSVHAYMSIHSTSNTLSKDFQVILQPMPQVCDLRNTHFTHYLYCWEIKVFSPPINPWKFVLLEAYDSQVHYL